MEWFLDNYAMIGFVLGGIDIILGALPDKVVKWPGATLAVAHKLYAYGKDAPVK